MTATLLRGGTIFDGVSPRRRQASILMSGGLIQRIASSIPSSEATTVIDLDGAWVTPGFIDPHSHADVAALTGEQMENRAHSGVTMDIVGQDGLGLAHSLGPASDQMAEILTPIAGSLEGLMFKDVSEYLSRVDEGAYSRVATLSPHGTIRAKVIGRELKPASESQLHKMAEAFSDDMVHGSLGLSTGLSYPPAIASDAKEVTSLLAATGPGTLYVTHLRSYGKDFNNGFEEAFDISARSGSRLHFSHFHVSGPGRENAAKDYLSRMSKITPRPTLDSYPYRHACTFLSALLPARFQELSYLDLRKYLVDYGSILADEIERVGPEATISVGWESLIVAGLSGPREDWNGLALGAIAPRVNLTIGEVLCEVISSQDYSPMVLVPQGHHANIVAVAQYQSQVVGSDGIFGSGAPHPRLTGTFFRFLRWALDGTINLTVEQAISKMTAQTAKVFGLHAGVISPGFPADLLVIDGDRIGAGDDVQFSRPDSIHHAFIAGELSIRGGVWLGKILPGMAVRATG